MWSTDALTFETVEHGTRVTFHNITHTPHWLRPIDPLLNAAFQRIALRAIHGARRHLDRQP